VSSGHGIFSKVQTLVARDQSEIFIDKNKERKLEQKRSGEHPNADHLKKDISLVTHSLVGHDRSEIDKNKKRELGQSKRLVERQNDDAHVKLVKTMTEVRDKNWDPFTLWSRLLLPE
jgi:hypothetical protein